MDYRFTVDNRVIGEWCSFDFYRPETLDKFNPSHKNRNGELFVKGISFATDGTCVRRQQNRDIALKWTEGFVLDSYQELSMSYEIRNVGGIDYLMIEWKSGDYVFGNKAPGYYVFVRASL